jgi:membrane-associated HD superfamily phosphohydrolase
MTKRWAYIFALSMLVLNLFGVLSHRVAAASVTQYIAPLECRIDSVDNGVNVQIILAPEECKTYLNPQTPDKSTTDNSLKYNPGTVRYRILDQDEIFFSQSSPVNNRDIDTVKIRYVHDGSRPTWTCAFFSLFIILCLVLIAIYVRTQPYKKIKEDDSFMG